MPRSSISTQNHSRPPELGFTTGPLLSKAGKSEEMALQAASLEVEEDIVGIHGDGKNNLKITLKIKMVSPLVNCNVLLTFFPW